MMNGLGTVIVTQDIFARHSTAIRLAASNTEKYESIQAMQIPTSNRTRRTK